MSKVIDINLMTRLEGETFPMWLDRFRHFMGHDPSKAGFLTAPFPQCKTTPCITTERFRWCMANIGMYKFHEYVFDKHEKTAFKLWIFEDEYDATMFKLRWATAEQDRNYIDNPSTNPFDL